MDCYDYRYSKFINIREELKAGTWFQDIRTWALKHKVPHSCLKDLLKINRKFGILIPKDSRTVLNTPKTSNIIPMGNGEYWYNGIEKCLSSALRNVKSPFTAELKINIDGISPFKSSTLEFWPILFTLLGMPDIEPMIICVYYGRGKPQLKEFLTPFVEELNELIRIGMLINNFDIKVKVHCFICDSPARSFIKGSFIHT